MDTLLRELVRLGLETHFAPQKTSHRRGNYKLLNFGISHGQGAKKPFVFNNDSRVPLIRSLLSMEELQQVAGYQDAIHAAYFPESYTRYRAMMEMVTSTCNLPRNFTRSNFPSATVNLGPQVQTFRHRDLMNYAGGVCLVTCFGNHDHTQGGHLILWELGIFIQFPHGTTVAIPSSIITHSNLPVAAHEQRVSFTQYAAGALFRWCDNGGKNDNELSSEELAEAKKARAEHFENILNYFTSVEEHIDM
jgi:hypothetical protein